MRGFQDLFGAVEQEHRILGQELNLNLSSKINKTRDGIFGG